MIRNNNSYDRFNYLIKRDGTSKKDLERKALFYIVAGNEDIYSKVDYIYDFDERAIKPECLESQEVDFCSSSRRLVKLAFNLFNGFPVDVMDIFSSLDENNFNLALQAIRIRFDM